MNENAHLRARQLLDQALVEGTSSSDEAWLKNHLSQCAECSREAASTNALLIALRRVPVQVPHDLAARTQMRVRLRAQEVAGNSNSGLVLWTLTAVSWLLGAMSAPLVWHGFAWLGGSVGVPKLVLEMGFMLWWIVPALFAVAAVLHQRGMGSAAKRP
jgi:predicted anti-sigma-YlaC factor YlaD